ncbi:MAG: diguanylate cyclase domain-containing protein [Elusimicrobiota bacterium]
MKTVDALVAASDQDMRARLNSSLRNRRLRFAENSEEAVQMIMGRTRLRFLIWDLNPDGEFDQGALEAIRKISPSLPTIVLDDACDAPRGGRSLCLGNLLFMTRKFTSAAIRGAAERCLQMAEAGDAREEEEDAAVDRGAFEHYLHESLAAKQVFEHLPVAALVVDVNRTILALNGEARRLTGATSDAVGKETCRSLWNCRAQGRKCPLRKAFARRRPIHRAEVSVRAAHGIRTIIERIETFQETQNGERRAVVTCGDATGFLKRMHRLNDQAHVDSLTRLLNRGHFEEAMSRCGAHGDRRKTTSLFVMIDVDGLKQVNDRDGHAAGDRLLRRLGSLLLKSTRRGELVGRLGGDEFGIHCSDITRDESREFVRRLRLAVKKDNALHPGEAPLSIGIGVSFSGDGGKDPREEADKKLRRYKSRRRLRSSSGPHRSPVR